VRIESGSTSLAWEGIFERFHARVHLDRVAQGATSAESQAVPANAVIAWYTGMTHAIPGNARPPLGKPACLVVSFSARVRPGSSALHALG